MHEAQNDLENKDYEFQMMQNDLMVQIRNRDDVIQNLKLTLYEFESREDRFNEVNLMMGEDFRSHAFETHEKNRWLH